MAQMIQAVAQQMQNSNTKVAKLGTKLSYIKSLYSGCPEGTQAHYYKQGGHLCKECIKQAHEVAEESETKKQSKKVYFTQNGQKTPKLKRQDEATTDSIRANKFNDQEVQDTKPGKYVQKNGKTIWIPDRTKAPYNNKKK